MPKQSQSSSAKHDPAMAASCNPVESNSNRRSFIKESSLLLAGGAVSSNLSIARTAHAAGSDIMKIGLVGCGRSGRALTAQALDCTNVRVVALADVFEDRLQQSVRSLKGKSTDRLVLSNASRGTGLDAYRRVLDSDADLVILATPPAFRPMHFEACVDAGKHVFMERPVAIDPAGVRRFCVANQRAGAQQLTVQVEFFQRNGELLQEILGQLSAGTIGDLVGGTSRWGVDSRAAVSTRTGKKTELEYHLRHWQTMDWLSGGPFLQRQLDSLEMINSVVGTHPDSARLWQIDDPEFGITTAEIRSALGMASSDSAFGRRPSASKEANHDIGKVVEFAYPGGFRLFSIQQHNLRYANRCELVIHGTRGWCNITTGRVFDRDNNLLWERSNSQRTGKCSSLVSTIAALHAGERQDIGELAANSALAAILGRQAAFSLDAVTWEECTSCQRPSTNVDALVSLTAAVPYTS